MYRYDADDRLLLRQRVDQFRDQTQRYLAGELSDDQFRPLRLMNGLYIQRHAPMLRIAIPYGLISAPQMRQLAHIARRYDRGYGHFTTRQNIQFNWIDLEQAPEVLAELAEVDMHAIQTSGNCIRNVTADHLAGISPDELEDPRPYCELIRQWSTLHPEFSFLPRKFKIAVTGAAQDRAASQVHDIGLHLVRHPDSGEIGFEVLVGGGLGRTPVIGKVVRDFLPKPQLLAYLDAILRVYNRHGRRDNKYKARIKILVNALGIEQFRAQVEDEFRHNLEHGPWVDEDELIRLRAHFDPPDYETLPDPDHGLLDRLETDPAFARWYQRNTTDHKVPGYRAVFASLKPHGAAPGDLDADQMVAVAELAERYSFGLIRVSHHQNLLLGDVRQRDLPALWQSLRELGLATPNIGTLTDMICCPGLDFCSLANAGAIPIARQIQDRFDRLDYLHDLGEIRINISGCMNACGHHHVGHIGILGVDKGGVEWYQLTLGGSSSIDTRLGARLGPAVEKERVAETIEQIIEVYLEERQADETFLATVQRLGVLPFRERIYETAH
ncbi:MAG: nitrite/sulfite reductase [Candidatus Competibacterales bacterium]|nr:nitrite/sulfite reductase [Candidatus Competibacterales bacterium]